MKKLLLILAISGASHALANNMLPSSSQIGKPYSLRKQNHVLSIINPNNTIKPLPDYNLNSKIIYQKSDTGSAMASTPLAILPWGYSKLEEGLTKDIVVNKVSYHQPLTNKVALNLSASSKDSNFYPATDSLTDLFASKIHDKKTQSFKTYNINASIAYGDFSYGVTFGQIGKQLGNKEISKNGLYTRLYNSAISYEQDSLNTSLAYFKLINQQKNTTDAIALGTDYKLLPGLSSYAQISYFQTKNKKSPLNPKKKTKGRVLLLGTKLSF